jgi:hypothetical protein
VSKKQQWQGHNLEDCILITEAGNNMVTAGSNFIVCSYSAKTEIILELSQINQYYMLGGNTGSLKFI